MTTTKNDVLLGYHLKIYLIGGNWLLVGGDFSRWGRDEQIFGLWEEDFSPSPSRENPDLHSSLRFFKFQSNLYTIFVILHFKFHVANIKWNLCQNTVKFQNMTILVDKICTNIQTSTGHYLLNWVLVSVQLQLKVMHIIQCLRAWQSCTVLRILYEQQWLCCLLPQVFSLVCMADMILFDAIKIES